MRFPINSEGLMVLVAEPPAQRRDFGTKELKTTEDGRPVFALRVLMMDGAESAPMRVTVAGDPGVVAMQPVRLVGLAINVMERRGETMMWATAERVEPVGPPLAGVGEVGGPGSAGGAVPGRAARKMDA